MQPDPFLWNKAPFLRSPLPFSNNFFQDRSMKVLVDYAQYFLIDCASMVMFAAWILCMTHRDYAYLLIVCKIGRWLFGRIPVV